MKAFILSSNKSVILMSVAITITVIVDERIVISKKAIILNPRNLRA